MLELYAQRWEQELFYKELKWDLHPHGCLRSDSPLTARQEVAALLLAYALLVDGRTESARRSEVAVVRVSFFQTLRLMRGLWQYLELSVDLLGEGGLERLRQRLLDRLGQLQTPKRRLRSCPRKVRQPVCR